MDWRWVGFVAGVCAVVASGGGPGRSPAAPMRLGHGVDLELGNLEARASVNPNDATSLQQLVDAYLDRAEPGLAQAALDRAPPGLRDELSIADARARTAAALGVSQLALRLEETVLRGCETKQCPRALIAGATRRAGWYSKWVELGVDDPGLASDKAVAALKNSSREVKLSLD